MNYWWQLAIKSFHSSYLIQCLFLVIRVLEDSKHDRCSCVFLISMIQSKSLCVAYFFDQISVVLWKIISNVEIEVLEVVINWLSQYIIFDVIVQIVLKSTSYIMIDKILDRIIENDSLKLLIAYFRLSNWCWCTLLFERWSWLSEWWSEEWSRELFEKWSFFELLFWHLEWLEEDKNLEMKIFKMRISRTRLRDDEWLTARSIELDEWFRLIDLN